MRLSFLFILVFSLPILVAGESEVMVEAPAYEGKTACILELIDPVNEKYQCVSNQAKVTNGRVSLSVEVEQSGEFFLRVADAYGTIYLAKDEQLSVYFNEKTLVDKRIYSRRSWVQVEAKEGLDNSLHQQISLLNRELDEFYGKYARYLVRNPFAIPVDSFETELLKASVADSFYIDYRNYSIEHLKFTASRKRKRIANRLKSKAPDYTNPAYLLLFNDAFRNHFELINLGGKSAPLIKAFNGSAPLTALKDIVGEDSTFTNDQILELLILKEIVEEYGNERYSRSGQQRALAEIAESSFWPLHRAIAANFLNDIRLLAVGTKFPSIDLAQSLDHADKYLLLGFATDWCTPCYSHTSVLADYHRKYGTSIQIATVLLNGDEEIIGDWSEELEEEWPVTYPDNVGELREKLKLRTVPTYCLIDEEGYVVNPGFSEFGSKIEIKLRDIDRAKFPRKYDKTGNW